MKYILLLLFSITNYSQQTNYNLTDGFVANGYDVVAYFDNTPAPGNNQFVTVYDNVIFIFSSKKNLNKFKANPKKYIPQYGGWCAYAMANKGQRVKIDPESYEIRDGKLYLFYNALLTNTLKAWLKKDPTLLIKKANDNWGK